MLTPVEGSHFTTLYSTTTHTTPLDSLSLRSLQIGKRETSLAAQNNAKGAESRPEGV